MSTLAAARQLSRRAGTALARSAIAAALCGPLALHAGIGAIQAGPSHTAQVTLVFDHQWIGPQENYLKAVIKRYEQLHPNIVINESVVADTTKIITALSGGKPPDIVDFGLGQFVPELASKGALTNLDPYIAASHLSMGSYVPASVQVVTYAGHAYGLPFMNFNHGLLYNRTLFRQAGIAHPPATLEELQADAYRLTKVDSSGKILQMGFIPDWPGGANGQAVNLVDYAWLFGGGWYNAGRQQITADNPANIKALTWETQFYMKYGAQHVDDFVKSSGAYLSNDIFASGKLAMSYDGEWWLDFAPPKFVSQIGAAPFPAPKGLAKYTGTSFIDTNPQVIPAGSTHKQAAFDFIRWETSDPGVVATFGRQVFNLPQLKNVPASAISSDPRFKVFVDISAGPNAHVFPRLPFAGEMVTKIQNAEAAALNGRGSPASVLQALQYDLQNSVSGQ